MNRLIPMSAQNKRSTGEKAERAAARSMISGSLTGYDVPFHSMVHPPAARTLRTQSTGSPKVIGTTKPSRVGRADLGVAYERPERRP